MRLMILVITMSLLTAPCLAITYPQLALGGGYECIVLITNKTAFQWTGTVLAKEGNDQLWNGRISLNDQKTEFPSWDVSLAPRGSLKMVFKTEEQLKAGYLEIVSSGDSSNTDVAVSFFFNYLSGGLKDSVGVPPGEYSDDFILPVEKTSTVNTGFAWAPWIIDGPFDLVLTLLDSDGHEIESKPGRFLGHKAQFFTEYFEAEIEDGFVGQVYLKARHGITLTALRLEKTGPESFQLTAVPPDSYVP